MSTQKKSATIHVTNNSGGNARIFLFHKNSSYGTQGGSWAAKPGETVGPLTVYFDGGFFAPADDWSVLIHVEDGPSPGFYVSSASYLYQYGMEARLGDGDAGQTRTFSVSATNFNVVLRSGAYSGGMTQIAPYAPVTHVFVVMLENHSFDNMFAMSGIKGIKAATTADSNCYKGVTYNVKSGAPPSLPTDPGHEFLDVVEQLGGEGAQNQWQPGGPFPPINKSGFVANYATTTDEETGLPPPGDFGDVMACFDTPSQLPALYQLATGFALCDRWHSSLPGLTWPNRFFVHGASSSGLDANPSKTQMAEWKAVGFSYPNGSIYGRLQGANIPYRFYSDFDIDTWLSLYSDNPQNGSELGSVPQVTILSDLSTTTVNSLGQFASDLQGPYPYPYTFIEPHYGNVLDNTYEGGSSQHPMDDTYGGEHLLAAVYSAIRNSPYWDTSLLLITYDEHGGLYDSVNPTAAKPPGDNPDYGYNVNGFDFDLYGVRVPGLVVSPLVPAGTVDHTVYDHASVLKTLEMLWGLDPLTDRDAAAENFLGLLSLSTPRTDCPTSLDLPAPRPKESEPRVTAEERARRDAQPVPQSGNLVGALQNLLKAEIEVSGGTPAEIAAIRARFEAIRTRGDARAYAVSVLEKIRVAREQRKLALRPRP